MRPNPGPGGYGVVLLHPKKRAEASGGFRLTTNNRMEIFASIAGLEMLMQPCKVTLYSDSQYLVDTIMKGWQRNGKRMIGGSATSSVQRTLTFGRSCCAIANASGGISLGQRACGQSRK